jgi:hypothetical protein
MADLAKISGATNTTSSGSTGNTHNAKSKRNGNANPSPTAVAKSSGSTASQRSGGSSGRSASGPQHRTKQKTSGVSALMLREMEELRSMSIGSPVPTPRPEDADEFTIVDGTFVVDGDMLAAAAGRSSGDETGSRSSSTSPFPAITVNRCPPPAVDDSRLSARTGESDQEDDASDGSP